MESHRDQRGEIYSLSYKLVIDGFQTKEQAEEFLSWYCGQGEQDATVWFEVAKDNGTINVDTMHVDVTNPLNNKWSNDNHLMMIVKPQ